LVNTTMELDPSIPDLTRETVISENKYNQLWKVTSVKTKMTSDRLVFGYDVDVRLIQNYESLFLLNLIDRDNVIITKNYRGLEEIQGMQEDLPDESR
jgi:hypothetical protein